jgi:hypothetical protein
MIYNVDDKVLLNVKNIIFIKSFKKLNYKYYDSYEIIELIKKQVYKLKLSFLLKEIHNVFHVFLLESHLYNSIKALELFSIIEVDDENQYEINEILNIRIKYEKLQYLIR